MPENEMPLAMRVDYYLPKEFLIFPDAENVIARNVENGAELCKGIERGKNVRSHVFGHRLRRHADFCGDLLLRDPASRNALPHSFLNIF